jgi:DNA-binding response OmpR family regulator
MTNSHTDTSATLLVIEDDDAIAEPLVFGLQNEGYHVLRAADGESGLAMALNGHPDAVLLDVMLPGRDGFSVCRALRADSAVPILMLTARGQELERVMGLELGADDYIVKPFSFRELLARVRAVLRRRQIDRGESISPGTRLVSGRIAADPGARSAWRDNRILELTSREFELLLALLERAGLAQSRQALLDRAWGESWIGDPRTLDVHIRWLREKIEDDPSAPRIIQTVRGYGYRLVDPDAETAAA